VCRARVGVDKTGIIDLADRTTQAVWRLGFRTMRYLAPSACRPWSSPGGQRVLVIAPHPDDEVVGCGGTILQHLSAGDMVRVVYVTDGRRSRAHGLGPDDMALRRRREAERAAGVFGLGAFDWIGAREGEWDTVHVTSELERCLNATRPDVVYAPSLVDFHPEHIRVAQNVASCLKSALDSGGAGLQVRIYQVHVPLTARLTTLVADVTKDEQQLHVLLAAHDSQRASTERSLRLRRYAAARTVDCGLVEPFWELTAARYVELHRDTTFRLAVFRGIRHRSWLDPLAYLIGRQGRQEVSTDFRRS
jgi:LmbE family N-acetylglucosaminyl deacetylase